MASISQRKDGTKVVSFVRADGERKQVRLGKIDLKAAEKICAHISHLNTAQIVGQPLETETAKFLSQVGKPLYAKLVNVGLAQPRIDETKVAKATLESFLNNYIVKRTDVKGETTKVYKRCRKHLVAYFGADKPLDEINIGDAKDWRLWLPTQGLGKNTIGRTCGIATQFFNGAIERRLIVENPFAKLSTQVSGNPDRLYFLSREDAQRVIDACPDSQWRLLFALSRFGGLRCPSEHLLLLWSEVDWERGRMIVHSPKTERHKGKATRVIPIFPELRPYLEAAWDQATPGTKYIITRYRDSNANLRTQLERIIRKAGLEPWPKLFHNLRATRETELAHQFPIHVVCEWIGNTALIAAKHYMKATESDFAAATSAPLAPPQTVPGQREPSHGVTPTSENPEEYVTLPPAAMSCDEKNGRHRTRTCDPYRVRIVL
jgi:integrase